MLRADDYEIAAFFVLVILFELLERLFPARQVNRLQDLKLDILSFAFALAVNRICTHAIRATLGDLTPFHLRGAIAWLQHLPSVVRIIWALFIVDFIIYWIHRAQHNYNLMWRTHAWHHSIEQMYWFAGFRTSFFHSLIYNIPQVVIPITLFKLTPIEAGIGYSLGLLIQFWEHTNLNIRLGRLEKLFITPAYHRIHHSATSHRGMNLGTTFSVWDRLFGTFVDPDKVEDSFPMGLGEPVPKQKMPRMLLGI